MALLELFPFVVAAELWGRTWSGERILLHCDNKATVSILQRGRSSKMTINKLMRRLTTCSAHNNFLISAQYIETKENTIADALSRFDLQSFRRYAPSADPTPTPVPQDLYAFLTR